MTLLNISFRLEHILAINDGGEDDSLFHTFMFS